MRFDLSLAWSLLISQQHPKLIKAPNGFCKGCLNWPVYAFYLACSLEQISLWFLRNKETVWRTFVNTIQFSKSAPPRVLLSNLKSSSSGARRYLTDSLLACQALSIKFLKFFLSRFFLESLNRYKIEMQSQGPAAENCLRYFGDNKVLFKITTEAVFLKPNNKRWTLVKVPKTFYRFKTSAPKSFSFGRCRSQKFQKPSKQAQRSSSATDYNLNRSPCVKPFGKLFIFPVFIPKTRRMYTSIFKALDSLVLT